MWQNDTQYVISYWCPIGTESLSSTVFEIFAAKYIWVTMLTFLGHVTSSVTWPFDSLGAISYRCSIVTESLSSTVFEIMGIFYIWVALDLSRSRDFIGHMTNRSAICHFLLLSHYNWTSISNRFQDIWPPKPVRTHRQTHTQTRDASDFILSHAIYCIGQTIIINYYSQHLLLKVKVWVLSYIQWVKKKSPPPRGPDTFVIFSQTVENL